MKQLLFILITCSGLQAAAQFSFADFKKLHALAAVRGWEMKLKKGSKIEDWHRVNDSLLSGRTYLLLTSTGDTMMQEEIELKFFNGAITYSPLVKDQNDGKPVAFTLAAINGSSFVFENTEHDFPQRILYALDGNSLQVTISSITNKEAPSRIFNFTIRN